jgi:hypothetical protein
MRTSVRVVSAACFALLAPCGLRGQGTAVAAVTRLYKDYAWEAVIEEPIVPGSLLEQPRSVLARYFDDTLTAALLTDRACAAKAHGICNLDFDPIWASQDPDGATSLRVTATPDSNVVAVSYVYAPNGSPHSLSYHLRKTPRGWRIHDIVYPDGTSLLGLLARPS